MSSTLESYVNHTVSVITADGRQIVGTLKGFDQTVNVILDDSHERVYSANQGVEQVSLGLYIVRGDNIDDLVDLYRQTVKIPIPLSGKLFRGENESQKSLRIVWKMRDMDRLEGTKFATNYSIKLTKDLKNIKHIYTIGEQTDVTNDLATVSRAEGSPYMAVIRKGPKDAESGKVKQILEIWDKTTKIKSIDVDSIEEHSNIVLDPQFANFLWSPNGKQLLYVAEYKPPKAQSYYKKSTKKSENSGPENDTRGQEFVYRDDWGEAFDGVVHTIVAILDIESDFKIRTIEMNGYSLGQPFWIRNGESVGFIGWNENPRRLGIIYCTNRLSSIFSYDLSSEDSLPILICGSDNSTVRDPRRTPDGRALIYLENESGGPHHSASRLMIYNFSSKTNEVLIDNNGVREIIPNGNTSKYGKVCTLFVDDLPENCFTSDGKYVVLNCFTELQYVLFLVNLKTKDLKPIEFPLQSVQLVDLKDDVFVVVGSSANVTPNVFIGKLNEDNTESIDWKEIKINSSDSLVGISSQNYSIPSEDPKKLLNFILVSPKSAENQAAPTVVIPHGGPHAVLINTYMLSPLMFAKLGLKTLLVNYRGSLGVDSDYVNTLTGNVGRMDVKDIVDCIKYLSEQNLVDSSKLILCGGSHGGFLVTHLSGQYHHMDFKACIVRNPVIDMSSKLDGTDIPDWGYVESFGKSKTFGFDTVLDPDSLKVMFEKSPINWINNVKVPTLMMLGKRDRRVPMTQGLKYYRLLKARGVKTQCHIYDDKHDLQKVEVDGDAFVNICLWIFDNLNN